MVISRRGQRVVADENGGGMQDSVGNETPDDMLPEYDFSEAEVGKYADRYAAAASRHPDAARRNERRTPAR
jgi:molybdenum-dependent DNA-binding transcriptional regulator ModE